MHLLVSILHFITLIHMLCHIMSYSCFIITTSTPIFLKFQKSILVSFKVTHSSCTVVTMITRVESWWLPHPMYSPLWIKQLLLGRLDNCSSILESINTVTRWWDLKLWLTFVYPQKVKHLESINTVTRWWDLKLWLTFVYPQKVKQIM